MDNKKVVKNVIKYGVKAAMVADTVITLASMTNPATAMTGQLVKKGMKMAVAKKFAKNATGIIAHEAAKKIAKDVAVAVAVDPVVDGAGAIVDAVAKANKKEANPSGIYTGQYSKAPKKDEVDPLGYKDTTQDKVARIYVPGLGYDVILTRADAFAFNKLGTYYNMVCYIQKKCNLTHNDARYVCDKFQLVYKNLL